MHRGTCSRRAGDHSIPLPPSSLAEDQDQDGCHHEEDEREHHQDLSRFADDQPRDWQHDLGREEVQRDEGDNPEDCLQGLHIKPSFGLGYSGRPTIHYFCAFVKTKGCKYGLF